MKEHKKKPLLGNILGNLKIILLVLSGLVLLLADQILKKFFMTHSYYYSFFSLHLVKNTGISFGLLPGTTWLMIIISFLFVGLLWWFREEFNNCKFCLVLLLAGTFGNLLDRIFLGYVVDYFDLGWFPVFNLADAMISLGMAGIIISFIVEIVNQRKETNIEKNIHKNISSRKRRKK